MKNILEINLNNDELNKAEKDVLDDVTYGAENKLIERILKEYPENKDIDIIALKIGLIEVTNSTNIAKHKSKISVVDLANHIKNIEDIDIKIEKGCPTLVNEIANTGKINLFSFASKYCCYHNYNHYGRDDYSIFDSRILIYLPRYFENLKSGLYKNSIVTTKNLKERKKRYKYEDFNKYIETYLDYFDITCKGRRRKLDWLVWWNTRQIKDKK